MAPTSLQSPPPLTQARRRTRGLGVGIAGKVATVQVKLQSVGRQTTISLHWWSSVVLRGLLEETTNVVTDQRRQGESGRWFCLRDIRTFDLGRVSLTTTADHPLGRPE